MNRMFRAILAIFFIGVITFSAIIICQNTGKQLRADVTEQNLYTLSEGTKSILSKVRQPIKMRLYYTKTAAMKAPDEIRFFNNYYNFVKSLLEEYVAVGKGMIEVEVIDPRPFTDDEINALRYGLKNIPMREEENFFFGLAAQTQFGVTKTIPFFSPNRQDFVEYDISSLIDAAVRREKKRIGVLSSLPVMGEQVSPYMAQMMRMQGQQPRGAWTIIEQLREKYEVMQVKAEVQDINDVDILLVIHPKDLPEKTLFAIDQFILKGGRAIVCVDPHCFSDRPQQQMQMVQQQHKSSSNLNQLFKNWGLNMQENTFAGDRVLAITASLRTGLRAQKIIGFLGLGAESFNKENVISANLNQVRVLFAGVLRKTEVDDVKVEATPLLSTTNRGNSWSVRNEYELMMSNLTRLMEYFTEGTEAVHMGYLVTGRFKSSFPDGIKVKDESDPNSEPRHLSGLRQATDDCVVAVFSDVDFISDMLAYRSLPLGLGRIPIGDNAALLLNAVDELGGSSDLISIRARGNFTRPFTVVNQIEAEAEKGTAEEVKRINAEIAGFRQELAEIVSSAKEGQEEVIGSSIVQKKRELELKIHQGQRRLRDVKMQERERIEQLGDSMRNLNTLPGPILVLLIAITLGLMRGFKKRRYISHASDA
ncbi:MAG: Gldg family protein [Planctomycetota bacterium]